MLKKILLSFLTIIFIPAVFAEEKINYKNLKHNEKISYSSGIWSKKINRKNNNFFIKKVPDGNTHFTEFYTPEGDFAFSTATQYEFIYKNSLIGYSNFDLKFYEYSLKNNILEQRELTIDEVRDLFPKYKILKVSEFSKNTNSIKFKKGFGTLKTLILNDTDSYFYNYGFTTHNSKFEKYNLTGFLDIKKDGMIQFSAFGENTKNKPWYILLIR